MTAAADKRLGRLLGRIAEERAARGRQPTAYRPKVLPTGLSGTDEEPSDRGSEASFVEFEITPRLPAPVYYRIVYAATPDGQGAQPVYEPVATSVALVEGVDYPERMKEYTTRDYPRRKVGRAAKAPKFNKLKALLDADAEAGFEQGENLDPSQATEIPDGEA